MNASASVKRAQSFALSLQRIEKARAGSIEAARTTLARRLAIGIGTFENIARARVKHIDDWVKDRLQALLIRELEAEHARLAHELDLARQGGDHPASQHIGAIETHLAAVSALLKGT